MSKLKKFLIGEEKTEKNLDEGQGKYMEFFQKKLKAKGVNSPSELSKEEKKKLSNQSTLF